MSARSPSLSPLTSLESSPDQEDTPIPNSDEALPPHASLAPASSPHPAYSALDEPEEHRTKRPRLTLSPEPVVAALEPVELEAPDASVAVSQLVGSEAPVVKQEAAFPQESTTRSTTPPIALHEPEPLEEQQTASQDLAFLRDLDPAELDFLPSSDPAALGATHPIYHPAPRPPPRPPVALVSAATRAGPKPSRRRQRYHEEEELDDPDDSGVFLDAEALHLSQDPDLAGGDEIMLAVGDEEMIDGAGEFDGDELWAGYDEEGMHLDGDEAGLVAVDGDVTTAEEEDSGQSPYEAEQDGFAFTLGSQGTQGAQGWDPSVLGAFQLASRKPIKLSEEAIRKATELLEAGDDEVAAEISPAPALSMIAPLRKSVPLAPMSFASAFSTGSGRAIAGPSSAALAQAAELLGPPSSSSSNTLHPPSRAPSPRRPESRFAAASTSFGGFTTASGAPVAPPSEASIARARGHIDSSPAQAPSSSSQIAQLGGFTTGGGGKVDMPSEETVAARERDVFMAGQSSPAPAPKFHLPVRSDLVDGDVGKLAGLDSPTTSRSLGGGSSDGRRTPLLPINAVTSSPAPDPRSPAPISRPASALSAGAQENPASATAAHSPPPAPYTTTSRPPPISHSTPSATFRPPAFRSPMIGSSSRPPTGGFRPPLVTSRAADPSTSTPLKPAPALRRLNLGMTPRGRRSPSQKTPGNGAQRQKKFETPFKGGKRPEGLTPTGLPGVGKGKSLDARAQGSGKGKGWAKEQTQADVKDLPKVFDLSSRNDRVSLSDYGLRPQTLYYEQAQLARVPTEILDMDSTNSTAYVFPCGRSYTEALAALVSVELGASLATLPWVKNHYSLIVWKLACYVRSRPDMLSEWWSWDMVLRQLRYRYEREINQAQRSCIKRIQEQDSPAGLPMVLCVSQLRWDDPSELEDGSIPPGDLVIVGLELTDGWYRIRTNVDEALRSACKRGKIVVGSKLAISGAKIDSSREGTDVLEALGRSSLVISGNSTSLAPWRSKLGFFAQPFVASLGSLTSSGGVAPLIDVIIERSFPYGYVDMAKGSNHGTWNEEEERLRKDEWSKGRTKAQARLADEMERTSSEWEEIIELLQDAAHRVGPASVASSDVDSTDEEPDEILDRLEGATNKVALIRKLTSRQVHGCLALAGENSIQARYAAAAELEKELATSYPVRDVRGFRVLRIRDARELDKPTKRTAQLTVWDAEALGPGYFQEGKRYLVTHVIPKGTWKRQSEEITLATRRDSKWKMFEGSTAV